MPSSTAIRQDSVQVPGHGVLGAVGLILGGLAVGRTRIRGLDPGADILAVAAALRALGAQVLRHDDGLWTIDGVGIGGLQEPAAVLDLGSSAIAAFLLIGLIATHPVTAIVAGDAAASRVPLLALLHPLERMGASFTGRRDGLLPLAVAGAAVPMPLEYRLQPAGAAIKFALLLAALNVPGTTSLVETSQTADPAERLFAAFGADLRVDVVEDGGRRLSLDGQPELVPAALDLADLSTGTV